MCVSVCRCRAHPPRRTTLDNELGPEAGTALAKAVEVNSSLAYLDLRRKWAFATRGRIRPRPLLLPPSGALRIVFWMLVGVVHGGV